MLAVSPFEGAPYFEGPTKTLSSPLAAPAPPPGLAPSISVCSTFSACKDSSCTAHPELARPPSWGVPEPRDIRPGG